ncbi:MAG: hypothetical protein R2724_19955 [Bryobacterales bacterium]
MDSYASLEPVQDEGRKPAAADDFAVFNQVQATASRRIRMRLGLPANLRHAIPVELPLVTAAWLLLCPSAPEVSWIAVAFEALAFAAAGAALVYFRRMGSRPLEIGWRIILFTRLLSLLSELTDVSALGPRLPERLAGALWAIGALGLVWGLRMERVRRATDIDRLKRAVSERRQAHRRFVDLVNTVDGVVWEATVNPFQFLFVSRSAGPILGFAPQIWMQQPNLWSERVHPRTAQPWRARWTMRRTVGKAISSSTACCRPTAKRSGYATW